MPTHAATPNIRVALPDGIVKCDLLPNQSFFQFCFLHFQVTQAADVGAVGCPDEVREHMHLPERFPDRRLGSGVMRQCRPVGTRNIPPPNRITSQSTQQSTQLGFVACLAKLTDCQFVPGIQGLIQQFGGLIVPSRGRNGDMMQLVFGGARGNQAKLSENLPEFAG